MENNIGNTYPNLHRIESEIDEILSAENLSAEKADFYKGLKSIIRLKIDSEELHYKFGKFEKVFTAMAVGDFTERMDIPNKKSLFSYMGVSVNAVIEELNANVVKRQYVEASIEYIPHMAIITDKSGAILFTNAAAERSLGKSRKELLSLFIANIFESKTQFGIVNPDLNRFTDIRTKIHFFDSKFDINLSVKAIYDRLDKLDGYLYIGKFI